VSRERIGKELEGMLSGQNAQFPLCLKFFNQMNLLSLLFTTNLFPHIPLREEVDAARWYCVVETSEWLQYLLEEESSCIRKYCNTPALSRIAMLASPLTPFTGTIVNSMTKNKPISEASAVLQWSLKFKNKDCTDVATIVQSLDRLTELADSVVLRELDMGFRVEIGTFLREVKELWKPCLALATAIRIYSTLGSHSNLSSGSADMTTAIQSTVTPFITLCDAIEHFGLEEVWTLRPLVNGGELIDVLGVSAGPMIGEAMRKQTLWQLEHPQGTKEQFLSTLNPPVS
jgi:tRNA nucleotidyltransferase (CCA-adding enzyme)